MISIAHRIPVQQQLTCNYYFTILSCPRVVDDMLDYIILIKYYFSARVYLYRPQDQNIILFHDDFKIYLSYSPLDREAHLFIIFITSCLKILFDSSDVVFYIFNRHVSTHTFMSIIILSIFLDNFTDNTMSTVGIFLFFYVFQKIYNLYYMAQ